MPCYSPLKGWRSKRSNDSGRRSIVFNSKDGFIDQPIDVPCGQCIGCRIERSRQWALRCMHESTLHDDNCFITLTYSDEYLPDNAALNLDDFQRFMKRFRKSVYPKKIRFFHCGEYGENNPKNSVHRKQYGISALGRPHYHAIIFGYDFEKTHVVSKNRGFDLYSSVELDNLWQLGFCTVGSVTFESAAYVARYCVKKINGDDMENHYSRVDYETGDTVHVPREYVTMSRRPGIAAGWYDKFSSDCYPKDFITERGVKMRPPKFYDRRLEVDDEELYLKIKSRRNRDARVNKEESYPERLESKEKVKKAQLSQLKRNLND